MTEIALHGLIMHTTSRLEELPAEILQRILALGNCENALAFLRTNRSLRLIANDRQVFKSIIDIRNGYRGQRWTRLPLTLESPIIDWARYALADSKVRSLPLQPSNDLHPNGHPNLTTSDTSRWLPHLILSHRMYPIL